MINKIPNAANHKKPMGTAELKQSKNIANTGKIGAENPLALNDFYSTNERDVLFFENIYINKNPLVRRKIISKKQDINEFFDNISSRIFKNTRASSYFSTLLKYGYVSLSSNAYANVAHPYSAVGVRLNPKQSLSEHRSLLDSYIVQGSGVGINLSDFSDPISELLGINSYFKSREASLCRPPAGIALLSVYHPKIAEFIQLKDNKDYENWCFDLSVILDDDFLKKAQNKDFIALDDGKTVSAKDIYSILTNSMAKSGEPGIIFSSDRDIIYDSCAAAPLQAGEGLSLAHINIAKFYNAKEGTFDYKFLKLAAFTLNQALNNIDPNGYIGICGYQELLNSAKLSYGSNEAEAILEKILSTIKSSGAKLAISPTATVSKILKTTPAIAPLNSEKLSYYQQIDTLGAAQKHLDGSISTTIPLKAGANSKDVDTIIKYAASRSLKGITVFPES